MKQALPPWEGLFDGPKGGLLCINFFALAVHTKEKQPVFLDIFRVRGHN